MKTDTPTLPLSDTAVLLRARLGPLRAWYAFLTDNIQGKRSIGGHRLLPCGRQHDGKAFRPIYAVSDIEEFVAKVLASVPTAGKTPIKPTTLTIDSGRHWSLNRFDKGGAIVAMLGFDHRLRLWSPR